MKYIILLIIVIAVLYVHYRGRVRYRFWRQLYAPRRVPAGR